MKNTVYCYVHRNCGSSKTIAPSPPKLLEIGDPPIERICQDLIEKRDFKSLNNFILTNPYVKKICQPLLAEAKVKSRPLHIPVRGNEDIYTVTIPSDATSDEATSIIARKFNYPINKTLVIFAGHILRGKDKLPIKEIYDSTNLNVVLMRE
jgi:hypothetical protein